MTTIFVRNGLIAPSERENVSMDTGIEELDLKNRIRDRPRLRDKLIQARPLHGGDLTTSIQSLCSSLRSCTPTDMNC
jgi:hypothetical protein